MPALVSRQKASSNGETKPRPATHLTESFEDDYYSDLELGPGDSQYELSANFDGFADDDSQVDMPTIASPQYQPKQIEPPGAGKVAQARIAERIGGRHDEPNQLQTATYSSTPTLGNGNDLNHLPAARLSEALVPKPTPFAVRHARFVDLWSRYQLFATLAFGAVGIGIFGFFLLSSSIGGQAVRPAILVLVVGFLGTVAFVLLSLTAIVLSALVSELCRGLRIRENDLD
jgi:hypothetical protein